MNTSNKTVLLISDMVGFGNLSTTAMLPILAYMGRTTYNLPTALVSNNFGYKQYALLDTTDYMRSALATWQRLDFHFDAIATGFIPSDEQARIVSDYCHEQRGQGTRIFVDPVMADFGQLYSGLATTTVATMRRMLGVADLCYPNYTEACLLTGTPWRGEGASRDEARRMVDELHRLGARSVIITSITIDGKPSVTGLNAEDGQYFSYTYNEIPIQFSGTGDVFAAILIGHLLGGMPLTRAVRKAMDGVYNLINLNKDAEDPFRGIPLERYLNIL